MADTVAHIQRQGQGDSALQPRGGRFGVAFDWGFAVQIGATGVAQILNLPLPGGIPSNAMAGVGALALAAGLVAQGEALRRGNGIAWRIQLGLNSLLTLGGVAQLVLLVGQLSQGPSALAVTSMLYTLLLLLGVSPTIVWLLLQPGSRRWYGVVSPEVANARHSGAWLTGTVAWAVVAGLVQFAVVYLQSV